MSRYFPMFINMEGRRAVLFGAGNIAARRLEALVEFGAEVRVIAPKISDKVYNFTERYSGQITIEKRAYIRGEIENADFVLSATDDPQTDEQIYRECREKGIPVNISSDRSRCDFYFPALIVSGGLTIGVCSGGEDHKLVRETSARIRKLINSDGEDEQ